MTIDIFNPQISVVAKGLEGKVITLYGGNNLGKTLQATRMGKPLYFPLEKGLNAIAGVPFLPTNSWAEFVKWTKKLAKEREKAKEVYQTIIIDSLDAFAKYATRYVCNQYGVNRIKDGNDGFGLWTEYATEVWEAVDRLVGLGMTVVFIAHAQEDKQGKMRPKGDARTLAPVIDNSDIVMYLHTNGVDEEGQVIKSSGYLAETEHYFARSRFSYIDTYLPEFTAENLSDAIKRAIEKQEEADGLSAVSYDEQQAVFASTNTISFEELKQNTMDLMGKLASTPDPDIATLTEIMEKYMGKDKKLSDARPIQQEALSLLHDELVEYAESLDLSAE